MEDVEHVLKGKTIEELKGLYARLNDEKPRFLAWPRIVARTISEQDILTSLTVEIRPVGFRAVPKDPEEWIWAVFCVLRALMWLHNAGFVHRERWPELVRLAHQLLPLKLRKCAKSTQALALQMCQ